MSQHDRPTDQPPRHDTGRHASPAPEGADPLGPRRIPPHGDVSPDGRHAWPRPSSGAKWLVWGGTVLGAAALTAGTVIAARHLLQRASPDDTPPARPSLAPRFADMDRDEREALRQRARARESQDARRAAHIRAEAAQRGHRPRPGLLQEVEANSASISNGVEHVMRSLGAAVMGFRTVAGQAGAIIREFGDTADMIRGSLDRDADRKTGRRTSREARERAPDDARPDNRPSDGDARMHRL